MRSWSVAGQDLLWAPDPAVWDAVAPILFPIVGWARDGVIRVGGRRFEMGVHGFAARRLFRVEASSDDRLRLADSADADTLRCYPFAYRLAVEFVVTPDALVCRMEVANEGAAPMPYAIGLHPGFRWRHEASARVTFDQAENPQVLVITSKGLFSAEHCDVPLAGRELPLTRDLLSREALCFLDLRSRAVTCEIEGFGRLRVEHDDMPHLALWSRPPAPFLCIESWTGHGDPDGFEGELHEKPSMRVLPPGGVAHHRVRYGFTSNLHSGTPL